MSAHLLSAAGRAEQQPGPGPLRRHHWQALCSQSAFHIGQLSGSWPPLLPRRWIARVRAACSDGRWAAVSSRVYGRGWAVLNPSPRPTPGPLVAVAARCCWPALQRTSVSCRSRPGQFARRL